MIVNVKEHGEHIRVLSIDRPPVNALDGTTIKALETAVFESMEDQQVRVIIITGTGEKIFAAGADMDELAVANAETGRQIVKRVKTFMASLRNGPKPVIAAINGLAAGGGLELAMACDIRIADPQAGLGLPEVTLGVLPGAGGTQMLPRLVGLGKAMKMMLSGQIVSAKEALAIGLIDAVASEAGVLNDAMKLAEKISRNAPIAIAEIKAAAWASLSSPLVEGLSIETEGFSRLCDTEDKNEGIAAFKERRKPEYQGR